MGKIFTDEGKKLITGLALAAEKEYARKRDGNDKNCLEYKAIALSYRGLLDLDRDGLKFKVALSLAEKNGG